MGFELGDLVDFISPVGIPKLVDKYITGGSKSARDAGAAQRQGLDAAMKRLQQFSAQQYQNRMQDLDKTMSFYNPLQSYLKTIYGDQGNPQQPQAPGPGLQPPGFPKLPPDPMGTPGLPRTRGHF